MTYAIYYSGLKKVLLGESKNASNYLSVMKYRLNKGLVKGEIQEHYSRAPDKFQFHTLKDPLPLAKKKCKDRGMNFYGEKDFLDGEECEWYWQIKKALQKGLKENDVLDWLETQGY